MFVALARAILPEGLTLFSTSRFPCTSTAISSYHILVFKVDLRDAIGASLISVIATSSGAAAAYVKEGFTNMRIGMFLEIATTLGVLLGSLAGARVLVQAHTRLLHLIFGAVVVVLAIEMIVNGIAGRL
jgi:uncharacterized membrane protein YfcA